MHPHREAIIEARKLGVSFNEISKRFSVNKSTLSYMLRNIKLTEDHLLRFKNNRINVAKKLNERNKATNYAGCFKGGLNCQKLHGNKIRKNLDNGKHASGLTYRADELPIKLKLESLYVATFKKEHLAGRYFDFCSENYIIEHTIDATKGLDCVISRFTDIIPLNDSRKKIAYVPVGTRKSFRLEKLASLGVEIKDSKSL